MNRPCELRASERVPLAARVQVVTPGKITSYALAINISLGGLLLSAMPLPVGSPCRLVIHSPDQEGGKKVQLEGTVVRTDSNGTAVQFATFMEDKIYASISKTESFTMAHSFIGSYFAYYKVSQSINYEGCQENLGVNQQIFRTVFLASFSICTLLAIFSVWAFRTSISVAPVWLKIVTSFGYASFWLAVIQPTVDLIVFRFLRNKPQRV